MIENKKIYTFTQLLERSRRLLEKDPGEYAKAFTHGTNKLVRGLTVQMGRWGNDWSPMFFKLYPATENSVQYDDAYCQVRSIWLNGERFTHWDIEATPTKYRKRMHKFLPVTLPEGMKCVSHAYSTKAIYHNADGSVSGEGSWESGRRGRAGRPGSGLTMLITRDSDGKHIWFGKSEFQGLEKLFVSGGLDTTPSLRDGNIIGASHSKIAWYNSMKCPEDLPKVWDEDRVRLMAAKVHSEFLAFAKQYPHCKIVMYPMVRRAPGENTPASHDLLSGTLFQAGTHRKFHILHRDHDDEPVAFYLPEIVLWWDDASMKSDQYHGGGALKFIRVIIPPYGCELLKPGKASAFSETFRWGKKSSGYVRAMQNKWPLETVFHSLRCKKKGAPADKGVERPGYSVMERGTYGYDQYLADLYEGRSLVCVYDASNDERRSICTMGAYAMPPSEILSLVKEEELIDSLPLC